MSVLAIPLAILASIFGMFFTGDSLNAMTLGGLALAIGILVDQSIVVLENVVRHVQMGKAPLMFQRHLIMTQHQLMHQ